MRICIVSRELAPFWGAGIGTYASQMARAWSRAGHEAHVATASHPGLREALRASDGTLAGVHIHTVEPAAPGIGRRFDFQRHAAAVRDSVGALHASARLDYVEFPDYWAEGHLAIAAAREGETLTGAVLGVRLHTPTREARQFNAEGPGDAEIKLLIEAEDLAIRSADAVVSPTRSLLDIVCGRLGGVECGRTRAVVPYPFDTASLVELGANPASCTVGDAGREPPEVLYFGRLERRKGVEVLIAAAARLLESNVNARFRLIGGDTTTGPGGSSMRAYLESTIDPRWRGRISIQGPAPRQQLGAAVLAATASGGLCCFPSLWENFPNACVEAMALGAPVVGSDSGGMGEIIADGQSGVLFRSGDAASLAAAIGRVLADGALRRRIATAAPTRIATLCDPAAVVQRMTAVIEDARRGAPTGCGR